MHQSRVIHWQNKLAASAIFRRWWVFWAIYSVLVLFAIAVYMVLSGELPAVAIAFIAFFLVRMVLVPILDFLNKKPHPYQRLGFVPQSSWFFSKVTKKHDSFVSDHAASLAAIASVFFYYHQSLGIAAIVLAVLNAAGRIVLGYHELRDILVGWIVGLLSAYVTIKFLVTYLILLN